MGKPTRHAGTPARECVIRMRRDLLRMMGPIFAESGKELLPFAYDV